MSGYNLPDDVTQDMIDAHYEPSEADLASMLPPEPEEGSAVRDSDGDVWQLQGGRWRRHQAADLTWGVLLGMFGPLHLLVDGPVITR